ncbi:MAG: hypothetical protein ACRC3B_18710 [Bacteroidia bacterium]
MCENDLPILLAALFLYCILPMLIVLVQIIMGLKHTLNRIKRKAPIKGWIVYWLMIAFVVTCTCGGVFAPENGFVSLLIAVFIPAIWFFSAGKISDMQVKNNHQPNK